MFKLHLKEHEVAAKFKYVRAKTLSHELRPLSQSCRFGSRLTLLQMKLTASVSRWSRRRTCDCRLSGCGFSFLLLLWLVLRCVKEGCAATFDSHAARKAHEKKHAGRSIKNPSRGSCRLKIEDVTVPFPLVTFLVPLKGKKSCRHFRGGGKKKKYFDGARFLATFTAPVWLPQVTAALVLIARCLNTPGENCRSTWPSIQVSDPAPNSSPCKRHHVL